MSEDQLKIDFSSEGDFGPLISTQPEKATPVRTTIIEEVFEQEVSPICDIPWSPIQSPSSKRLYNLVRSVKPTSAKKLFPTGEANGDETLLGDKENEGSNCNTNEDVSMVEIVNDEKPKSKPRKSRLQLLKEEQLKRIPPLRSLDRYKDTSLIFSLESQSQLVFGMETSPVAKSNYFNFKKKILDQCYEERKERRLQYEANIKLYERENYDEEELAGDLEMSDDSELEEEEDEEEIEEIDAEEEDGNEEMNADRDPESEDGGEEKDTKNEAMKESTRKEPEEKKVGREFGPLISTQHERVKPVLTTIIEQVIEEGEVSSICPGEEDELEENEADKAFINDALETSENEKPNGGDAKAQETLDKEHGALEELKINENEKQVEPNGGLNSDNKVNDDDDDDDDDDDEPVRLDVTKKKRPMIIDDDEDSVEDQNLEFEDLPTDGENNEEEQEALEEEEDGEEDTLNQTVVEKPAKKPRGFLLDEAEVSGSEAEADDEGDEGEEDEENEEGEEPIVTTKDFILDEAELSGSDSSDEEDPEDEVEGMIGDSDAEELDEDQVRGDIQKVYNKQLLNEEKRLVLEMKERYLQDGDLHSDTKRKKNFRWRTVQTEVVDDDRLFSSTSESEDDDDEGNRPWQLKPNLPQKPLNSTTSSLADNSINPLINNQIRASFNGPSNDIKSYLVRDEHLKNVLSTTKRPDPFDRYRIGIKKLKPNASSLTKSLFDLFSS